MLGFVNWHWHYEFQLTYVVRGTISVFFNQQTIDLHEGQGIYINPEVLHMIRDRYDSDAMFISLDVSPKLLTSFPNSVFERSYVKPVFCSSAADAVILDPGVFWQKKILDEAMSIEQDYKSHSFGWELAVSSSLYAIWKELVCHLQESLAEHDAPTADGARMRRNQRLKDTLAYIREHFTEKITLDEIAKHLHLSTNECCRFFQEKHELHFVWNISQNIASAKVWNCWNTPICRSHRSPTNQASAAAATSSKNSAKTSA